MGALNPLFLLAGLAVGVPLVLHLFHRHQARPLSFPALRYLERTERDHARRIRMRQLLLLVVRILAVLLVVGGGARLFLSHRLPWGSGSAHPPTAVAIVLDNSMSSGAVDGEVRVLDRLKALALHTLDEATAEDRIWVIRAGEPWTPAAPGGPDFARAIIEDTEVSAARGDLSEALDRAEALVGNAGLEAAEIHVLSDLQATAFDLEAEETRAEETGVEETGAVEAVADETGDRGRAGLDVPVVVWVPEGLPSENRALTRVLVGGGLPPIVGQRSEVAIRAAEGALSDTVSVPVRIVLDGSVRGAGSVRRGASLILPLPPAPEGWVAGYADADPDALRADDRRYFAFEARPSPKVALTEGGASTPDGFFLADALSVLTSADRVRAASLPQADVVISREGVGLDAVREDAAVLILPPRDPALLPAVNRRLSLAGVPWSLERRSEVGEADLGGRLLPDVLDGVRVRAWFNLTLTGDPPGPTRRLADVAGDPWAVEGTDARGRKYLLLASPLDAASTSLPLSPDMVRFVAWLAADWAAGRGGGESRTAGEPLPAPRRADRVRLPSGEEIPVDGTRSLRATGDAGLYTFLDGDRVLSIEAVNPPLAESELRPLDAAARARVFGPERVEITSESAWRSTVFHAHRGPELWWPLTVAALLLLLVEAWLAAGGRARSTRASRQANDTGGMSVGTA